jgi:serine O-acetyltransferase
MELTEGLPEWNAGRKTEQVRREIRRELRRRLRASRPSLRKAIREDGRAFITHRFETAGPGRLEGVYHLFRLSWKSDAFLGVLLYRVRAWLQGASVPILPTLIHRICIVFFDVSIGDYLVLGEGVYVPHGYLVIDGPVVIGRRCVLCPWVTVGLTPGTFDGPELGDGVFVGTGAKILGPVKIGDGAIIGAGSVVLKDVPAHTTVAGVPARVIGDQSHGVEPPSEMP